MEPQVANLSNLSFQILSLGFDSIGLQFPRHKVQGASAKLHDSDGADQMANDGCPEAPRGRRWIKTYQNCFLLPLFPFVSFRKGFCLGLVHRSWVDSADIQIEVLTFALRVVMASPLLSRLFKLCLKRPFESI